MRKLLNENIKLDPLYWISFPALQQDEVAVEKDWCHIKHLAKVTELVLYCFDILMPIMSSNASQTLSIPSNASVCISSCTINVEMSGWTVALILKRVCCGWSKNLHFVRAGSIKWFLQSLSIPQCSQQTSYFDTREWNSATCEHLPTSYSEWPLECTTYNSILEMLCIIINCCNSGLSNVRFIHTTSVFSL